MAIDTEVPGDPVSCRALAQEIRTGGSAARRAGQDAFAARNASQECWGGETAELFRSRITDIGRGSEDIAEFSDRVAQATEVFADDLTTVVQRMQQARTVAATAGLPVSGTVIGEVPPAPAPLPVEGVAPEQVAVHSAAVQTHQAQVAAFGEVTQTVADARVIEQRANRTLAEALGRQSAFLQYNVANAGWTAWAFASGAAGSAHGAASTWSALAARRAGHAANLGALATSPAASAAFRDGAGRWAQMMGTSAAEARRQAESAARALGGVGRSSFGSAALQRFVSAPGLARHNTPVAFARGADGVLQPVTDPLKPLTRISSRLPYIGIGTAAAQIAHAWRSDQPVGKAAIAATTSFAAGAVGTSAATTALIAAGMAAGPAGWIAVGAGTALAVGVGFVVDEYGEEIAELSENTLGKLF